MEYNNLGHCIYTLMDTHTNSETRMHKPHQGTFRGLSCYSGVDKSIPIPCWGLGIQSLESTIFSSIDYCLLCREACMVWRSYLCTWSKLNISVSFLKTVPESKVKQRSSSHSHFVTFSGGETNRKSVMVDI